MQDLVLLPGIVGNVPHIAKYLTKVPEIDRIHAMRYPDIYASSDLLLDMNTIVRHLSEEILARIKQKNVSILGYSFGGCVALEVARALRAAGLQISSVFIVDAPLKEMNVDFDRSRHLGVLTPRTRLKQGQIRLVEFLCTNRSARVVVSRLVSCLCRRHGKKVNNFIVRSLRERARRATWTPSQADFEGIIFFSTQFAPSTASEWRRLCPRMLNVSIAADHLAMIEDPHAAGIAGHVLSYLAACRSC